VIVCSAGVLPGTAVVLVADLARVFLLVFTLKIGLRKVAEAVTLGVSAIAQLHGYARWMWTPNLHVAVGWLLSYRDIAMESSLCLLYLFGGFACMIFVCLF
jgi:hypothetical protein